MDFRSDPDSFYELNIRERILSMYSAVISVLGSADISRPSSSFVVP